MNENGQRGIFRIFIAQPYLGNLDIPVAVLRPQKIVDTAQRLAELEVLVELRYLGCQMVQTAQNPAVLGAQSALFNLQIHTVQVGDNESASVPQLVGEVA